MSILTQIIEQMYIDPELLEQLSIENREVLFRKIREEQVRRWAIRETELEKKDDHVARKKSTRKINFLLAKDGQPWVWVMGEHADDLSYEELVCRREEEERERERLSELQDRKESEELAKLEARSILFIERSFGSIHTPREGRLEVDGISHAGDLTGAVAMCESGSRGYVARTESQTSPRMTKQVQVTEEEARKNTLVRKASLIGYTEEEQRQFERKRAEEMYSSLQRAKYIAKRRAEQMSKNIEELWKESERKAKDYEQVRRSSFKKARELASKDPSISKTIIEQIPQEKRKEIEHKLKRRPARRAPPPPKMLSRQTSFIKPGTTPKTMSHVVRWFREDEAPKGIGREKDGSISIWFHGKFSRDNAEKLLVSKPVGAFLVRLSPKIWGYCVSVKTYTDTKHFLVDASHGKYHFIGPKQQRFDRLSDLLMFYRVNPITWAGQEVLLLPVGQDDMNTPVFEGLFSDQDSLSELHELEESFL